MNQRGNTRGFTLIELMLSMTFISVLLLTIALTIIQMSTIYNQGMTLKEVNQAARDVADDLSRTVRGTGVFNVGTGSADTPDYVAARFGGTTPTGGRLCTGSVSYVWNYAKAVEDAVDKGVNKGHIAYFTDSAGGAEGAAVNLVRVPDPGGRYCAKNASGELANRNIAYADRDYAKELLKTGDRTIRLIAFSITSTDSAYDAANGQRLYTVRYRLGTGSLSAMNTDATQCLPPSEPNANPQYCNVQEFSIVLRAGNTVN